MASIIILLNFVLTEANNHLLVNRFSVDIRLKIFQKLKRLVLLKLSGGDIMTKVINIKISKTPRTVYPFHHKAVKDGASYFDRQSRNAQESSLRFYYEQYQNQQNNISRKRWSKNHYRFN